MKSFMNFFFLIWNIKKSELLFFTSKPVINLMWAVWHVFIRPDFINEIVELGLTGDIYSSPKGHLDHKLIIVENTSFERKALQALASSSSREL